MASEKVIKTLIKKRGVCKARLSRIRTFLDNYEEKPDKSTVKVRYEAIPQILTDYNEVQTKLETEDEENYETHLEERLDFEDAYYSIRARMESMLSVHLTTSDQTTNLNCSNSNQHLKLPPINLKTFDGKYENWLSFSDSFKVMVHNNNNLSVIQKFYYLTSTLKNDAAHLIENLPVTETNYPVAWKLLVDRFENKKLIASAYVREILNIKSVHKEDAADLRHFINTAVSNLNALKALNTERPFYEILLEQLYLDRLDNKTRREWEMKDSSQSPTLETFFDFLEHKCQALEALQAGSNSFKPSKFVTEDRMKQKPIRHTSNVYISTEANSCKCCNQPHSIYKCLKFSNLSIEDKTNIVKDKKLCFNCLRSTHVVKKCPSTGCRLCSGKHHTLLHRTFNKELNSGSTNQSVNNSSETNRNSNSSQEPVVGSTYCSMKSRSHSNVLLSTACVMVRDTHGRLQQCRVLLDSASQSNFISEECVQRLGLSKVQNVVPIVGINNVPTNTKYSVDIQLFSMYSNFNVNISCLMLPEITGEMPAALVDYKSWNLPDDLDFADPMFHIPNKIDLLLGAELYLHILRCNKRSRAGNYPIIYETELGWILSGKFNTEERATVPQISCFTRDDNLHQQIEQFWKLEELHDIPKSNEELQIEEHFTKNTTRDKSGRFIVRLPFKDNQKELGDSFERAVLRFQRLENRLQRNPILHEQYKKVIEEYEALGHMRRVPLEPNSNDYYLPHHGVMKESSTTTKLRVVYDASAKTSNGVSLNDNLMVGPTIQQDLFSIMVRFRTHAVAFTADIEQMYRQVRIHPDDQRYQRILWRDSPSKELQCFELTTVTFGVASAPFLAIRCLQQLANEEGNKYPKAAEILRRDFYVDDLVSVSQDIESALQIQTELIELLKLGGFRLRKWASNHRSLLDSLPNEDVEVNAITPMERTDGIQTLGLKWKPESDIFVISKRNWTQSATTMKREVASIVASIYDPIGLISPIVISYKIFLQQLWLHGTGWDDGLSPELFEKWNVLVEQLKFVDEIKINRRVLIDNYTEVEVHGFCDASQRAYGACLYLRSVNSSGEISVQLLCSRSRVAPTAKVVSLPRLELLGALLLSKLLHKTLPILNVTISSVSLWTDSKICLAWIAAPASKWKVFVANRIAEIQEYTKISDWRHVSSADNPADLISRGVDPKTIVNSIWWHGPRWLSLPPTSWPSHKESNLLHVPEVRKSEVNLVCSSPQPFDIINRYSSLLKLTRVLSYCQRFIRNCRTKNKNTDSITTEEIQQSLSTCIWIAQQEVYTREIKDLQTSSTVSSKSQLYCLHPFLDKDNKLRVGGRLDYADVPFDIKHQVILPPRHHLTILIVKSEHLRLLHAGPQSLLAALRLKYWIPRAKQVVKSIIHQCLTCFRLKAATAQQLMGQLPKHRVEFNRPFLNCGVDYAGPFVIKLGNARSKITTKCYVAVFICFTTRAIHLEVVTDLSSQAFLAALRRFIARRGHVANLYSDNGTNFVGADKALQKFFSSKEFKSEIENYATTVQLKWHFIPASSPHHGGLWEAAVKSMKFHLKRVVGKTTLTLEEFNTLIIQIEAILNSRPICSLSNDPSDPSYLSPGHFLIGAPLISLPEPDTTEQRATSLTRWQHIQKMRQHLWARWSKDYLHGLQQRPKWRQPMENLQEGSVVIIKDDNLPPMCWKMGVIKEVFPGPDGLVRVVNVKSGSSLIRRPCVKVIPLPQKL